jgi:antitoxin (DNA-binding transcriptional repressor) of toxin-antitoxin stability system
MLSVNMLEAKSSLSRLVASIEQGLEQEIIIARHGRPVAKLVPIQEKTTHTRIGIAKGLFDIPDNIDHANTDITQLFMMNGTMSDRES